MAKKLTARQRAEMDEAIRAEAEAEARYQRSLARAAAKRKAEREAAKAEREARAVKAKQAARDRAEAERAAKYAPQPAHAAPKRSRKAPHADVTPARFKPHKWTEAEYKAAIKGEGDVPGLRSIANGFNAADGFDLRDVGAWTAAQKRRIREAYHGVKVLEAQPKRIIRPRSKKGLERLTDAFHGDVKIPGLKVAFIPYIEPPRPPGAKRRRVKIGYRKGVIKIDDGYNVRVESVFDKVALVKDTAREIKRAIAAMGEERAKLLFLQVGAHQTRSPFDVGSMIDEVKKLMMKYDGRTVVDPHKNPRHHEWRQWLHGIVGYRLPKGVSMQSLFQKVSRGLEAKRARNRQAAEQRMRARRKK